MAKLSQEVQNYIKEDLRIVAANQRSVEELKLYETEEDMPETKRLLFLISRGKLCQKLTALENLPRVLGDADAYRQMMPFVLDKLLIWDREIQQAFINALESKSVQESLQQSDAEILLFKLLSILQNLDLFQTSLVHQILRLLKSLFQKIAFEPLSNLVLQTAKNYVASTITEERRIGYDMIFSVIQVHFDVAFDRKSAIRHVFRGMELDGSWVLRKQFFRYSQQLLQLLAQANKDARPRLKQMMMEFLPDKVLKVVQEENTEVAIEGLIVIHDWPELFSDSFIKSYYKPLAERIFAQAKKTGLNYPFKLQVSKVQGKILDFLNRHNLLDPTLRKKMFDFFKSCVESQPKDSKKKKGIETPSSKGTSDDSPFFVLPWEMKSALVNAAFNLPCFFKHMKDQEAVAVKEEGGFGEAFAKQVTKKPSSLSRASSKLSVQAPNLQTEVLKLAVKISKVQEPDTEAKIILVACLHELFAMKTESVHLKLLLTVLKNLIASAQSYGGFLLQSLFDNLARILNSIYRNIEIKSFGQSILDQRNKMLHSLELAFFFQDLCSSLSLSVPITHQMKLNLEETENSVVLRPPASQLSHTSSNLPPFTQAPTSQGRSPWTQPQRQKSVVYITHEYPESLQKHQPLETLQDAHLIEALNQPVLDRLIALFRALLDRKGLNYKEIASLVDAVGKSLGCFNAVSVDRGFSKRVIGLMASGPECIKDILQTFLLRLVNAIYKTKAKEELVQQVQLSLMYGNAKQRKQFLKMCVEAMLTVDDDTFFEHFLSPLIEAFKEENEISVLSAYLDAIPIIWGHLKEYGEDKAIQAVYEMTQMVKLWPDVLRKRIVAVRTEIHQAYLLDQNNRINNLAEIQKRRKEVAERSKHAQTKMKAFEAREKYETAVMERVKQEQETIKLMNPQTNASSVRPMGKGLFKSNTLRSSTTLKKLNSQKSTILPRSPEKTPVSKIVPRLTPQKSIGSLAKLRRSPDIKLKKFASAILESSVANSKSIQKSSSLDNQSKSSKKQNSVVEKSSFGTSSSDFDLDYSENQRTKEDLKSYVVKLDLETVKEDSTPMAEDRQRKSMPAESPFQRLVGSSGQENAISESPKKKELTRAPRNTQLNLPVDLTQSQLSGSLAKTNHIIISEQTDDISSDSSFCDSIQVLPVGDNKPVNPPSDDQNRISVTKLPRPDSIDDVSLYGPLDLAQGYRSNRLNLDLDQLLRPQEKLQHKGYLDSKMQQTSRVTSPEPLSSKMTSRYAKSQANLLQELCVTGTSPRGGMKTVLTKSSKRKLKTNQAKLKLMRKWSAEEIKEKTEIATPASPRLMVDTRQKPTIWNGEVALQMHRKRAEVLGEEICARGNFLTERLQTKMIMTEQKKQHRRRFSQKQAKPEEKPKINFFESGLRSHGPPKIIIRSQSRPDIHLQPLQRAIIIRNQTALGFTPQESPTQPLQMPEHVQINIKTQAPTPLYAQGSILREFQSQLGIRGSGNETLTRPWKVMKLKTLVPPLDVKSFTSFSGQSPAQFTIPTIHSSVANSHIPPSITERLKIIHEKQSAKINAILMRDNLKVKFLTRNQPEFQLSQKQSMKGGKKSFLETLMQGHNEGRKVVRLKGMKVRKSDRESPQEMVREFSQFQQRTTLMTEIDEIKL